MDTKGHDQSLLGPKMTANSDRTFLTQCTFPSILAATCSASPFANMGLMSLWLRFQQPPLLLCQSMVAPERQPYEDTKQLLYSMKQTVLTLLYPPASFTVQSLFFTKSQAKLNQCTPLPQTFLTSFIACQVFLLKSTSQKGPVLKYQALRYLTGICRRQTGKHLA